MSYTAYLCTTCGKLLEGTVKVFNYHYHHDHCWGQSEPGKNGVSPDRQFDWQNQGTKSVVITIKS